MIIPVYRRRVSTIVALPNRTTLDWKPVLLDAVHHSHESSPPGELRDGADPLNAVRRLLDVFDTELDYTRAKLAFDAVVDPAGDSASTVRELDALTLKARALANGDRRPSVWIAAVRTLLHKAGPWNDQRVFAYDMSDPEGRGMPGKLLQTYLATRLGQCVSMPVLFLILAERLGVQVAFASAPEHVFVRYRDETERWINLETTSGAHPARDAWYCEQFPITGQSIRSGLYLRTLNKREGIAVLTSTVVEHLLAQSAWDEAIAVCRIVLQHHPREAFALIAMGRAYAHLLDRFLRENPNPKKLSPEKSSYGRMLVEGNARCFATAENFGWMPFN